jgi:hypothetical protein
LAEYPAFGVQDSRQALDQILKIYCRRQQRVEPRILEQSDCRGKTATVRPSWPVRWRDLSDLARDESQPTAVEGAPEHGSHGRIAIPAHFKHGCLIASQLNGRPQPIGGAAGMNDEVAVVSRFNWPCETNPERFR